MFSIFCSNANFMETDVATTLFLLSSKAYHGKSVVKKRIINEPFIHSTSM